MSCKEYIYTLHFNVFQLNVSVFYCQVEDSLSQGGPICFAVAFPVMVACSSSAAFIIDLCDAHYTTMPFAASLVS